jgi:toluene monooxygenase system ferredoxin subunit
MPFVRLCADDMWEGEMESFEVEAEEILVIKLDGRYCAYQGVCPHQSTSLVDGELADGVLTCRAHLWQFDARTGRGINPESACLRRFPVEVVDGEVRVDVGGGDARSTL